METDKIVQELNKRFAEPLPEFYKRRIIVWHDEECEFEDKLEQIVLENAELVALTGSNTFSIKKLLSHDDIETNYLVYSPLSFETLDDNWMLDIELYSEEFRADLISVWMDEMDIVSNFEMRKMVKAYRKFFNAKDRRAKIVEQKKSIVTPVQLHLAVMAAICGEKNADPDVIIRTVLLSGIDEAENSVYQDFVTYNSENVFWAMITKYTGYIEEEKSLTKLATHILLTAVTRTMNEAFLAGLDNFISLNHQPYCYDLISDWMHGDNRDALYNVARDLEYELKLNQRFAKLSINDLINTEVFPCVDEIILSKLMLEIKDHIIDIDVINSTLEKRRTCIWHNKFNSFYDGLQQVANMQEFYKENVAGFHIVEPKLVWNEYANSYYVMDTYYRLFHLAFQKSLESSNMVLDDLFKHVAEKVEGLYTHWFLGELGANWFNVCADQLEEYGKISEVPLQSDFYRMKVEHSDTRVFVIVSDALRYEVAVSLTEQLKQETQSKVSLSSMQGIFPTTTKFGMAALLPNKEITAEDNNGIINVYADGQPTTSNNRDKVLKEKNSSSVALQYKNIIGLKRAERSALVKGMDVVYIYHNTIDEASHYSDTEVFTACDKAISEIKNIIRIITNEFSGVNIMVTTDHGFLYTYSPLTEESKVDKSSFNGMDVEYGRRYAIMKEGASPEHLMPVKFLNGKTDYIGFTPRENVRIKMSGGGLNFVHGGVSLQEMVIPLIEYRHLRNTYQEYQKNKSKYDTKPVEISLLSSNRKISNLIFSLNFYQKDPVGDNREAVTYFAYFVDKNGQKISDQQKIIADKISDDNNERIFRCNFNLKSMKYNKLETYYLVIVDESGLQLPQKEEFQIDIAFAFDDFGFDL